MTCSPIGRAFIKLHEGARYVVYADSAGYKTVGFGHRTNKPIGTQVSPSDVNRWFDQDVALAEHCANSALKVGVAQEEFDMIVSLIFNVGCGAFRTSSLLKVINGEMGGSIAEHWMAWDHVNGKVSQGLKNRRQAELVFMSKENGPIG